MSISFDLHDIDAAISFLNLDRENGLWLNASDSVVHLHFVLLKEELIDLIDDGKTECLDWQDDEDNWHMIGADGPELPETMVSCRYILTTA